MKTKKRDGFVWLVIGILFLLNVYIGNAHAKKLKQISCEAIGCPGGPRKCADLSGKVKTAVFEGGATFYCYEPDGK